MTGGSDRHENSNLSEPTEKMWTPEAPSLSLFPSFIVSVVRKSCKLLKDNIIIHVGLVQHSLGE